ncbi:Gypsy retrotransposon integrase-like protein 1 [Marasmius crinis-equi]|uniref:Gypsy retrotransposon integrase-like protein 1 n=1 Tax=Marasmius crinis-equi TaxID=585013 RepID=A0ABR3FLC7_9AGAR
MSGSQHETVRRGIKKRRIQNACDTCRQKKGQGNDDSSARISGLTESVDAFSEIANMPGNVCSNCIMFDTECTHVLASSKKRGGPKPPTQDTSRSSDPPGPPSIAPISFASTPCPPPENTPESTSTHQELTETVLSASYIFPNDLAVAHDIIFELATYARSLEQQLAVTRISPSLAHNPDSHTNSSLGTEPLARPYASTASPSYDEEEEEVRVEDTAVANPMKRLDIGIGTQGETYHGRTSDMVFIKSALSAKADYSSASSKDTNNLDSKRPEFWETFPWQRLIPQPEPSLHFPSPELISLLMGHFFEDYNIMFPLLHKPTFEKDIANGRHLIDVRFGLLLLSVCAIGSRYVDVNDPRVLAEGALDLSESGTSKKHSLGWKWYRQIGYRALEPDVFSSPDVCQLQLVVNCIMFLHPTSTPEMCWVLLGHGMRHALGVGAHRRSFLGGPGNPSTDRELWKRAFWGLVSLDIGMSAFLGRPRAITPAEYDIELPLECDDEYWDHPDPQHNFQQPSGKPSTMSNYIQGLKLMDIFGFMHQTIQTVRKPRGTSVTEQEQIAVKEFDQALEEWIDNIPDHLRWSPHMHKENKFYFNQSCALHVNYYWVQIQIHRSFIQGRARRDKAMAFSSLAVCANAARSCSHVMALQAREGGLSMPFPGMQMALFNAAIVLLLNIWRGKSVGITTDPAKELNDVYKCVNVLRTYEERWQISGRLCDILMELVSFSDLGAASSPFNNLKRPRSPELSTGEPSQSESSFGTGASEPTYSGQQHWGEGSSSGLPLYTKDLGRLPLHGSTSDMFGVDFHDPSWASSQGSLDPPQGSWEATSNVVDPLTTGGALTITPGEYGWEDWSTYISSIDGILRSSLDHRPPANN